MVQILVVIIENVNIFDVYEILFRKVIKILPTIYQNKTKMPGKNRKCLIAWFICKKWQVISTIYKLLEYIIFVGIV